MIQKVASENLLWKPSINWAVKRVTRSLQVLWPRSRTNIFGSNATGLSLPSSDVDLVVCLPPVRNLVRLSYCSYSGLLVSFIWLYVLRTDKMVSNSSSLLGTYKRSRDLGGAQWYQRNMSTGLYKVLYPFSGPEEIVIISNVDFLLVIFELLDANQ